ncbi:hypothetical protein [Streptomyces sp. NPDC048590]
MSGRRAAGTGHPAAACRTPESGRGDYRFLRIARFFALASFSLRCATP